MTPTVDSGSRLDRWLSAAAAIGAICAVAIALYQAALAREQQRASAWPYLSQSNNYVTGQPYRRLLENQGIGPARVRNFQVRVDDKPAHSWSEAVSTLTGQPDSGLIYSSLGRGSVLPPGATLELLRVPPGDQARRFWLAAQTRLATVACYCSVYNECWNADSRADEPVPVRACVDDSAANFSR